MTDDYKEAKSALNSLRCNALNIQSMLRLATDGKNSSEILTKVTEAIENHFNKAESLKIEFPEENREEHKKLLAHFKLIHNSWQDGEISDADYAEALNLGLFDHFSGYFQPLLDNHFDEETSLSSRV
jgi:hemerythrin